MSTEDMQRFDSSREKFWNHVDALLTPLDANRRSDSARWCRPIIPDSKGRVTWDVIGKIEYHSISMIGSCEI